MTGWWVRSPKGAGRLLSSKAATRRRCLMKEGNGRCCSGRRLFRLTWRLSRSRCTLVMPLSRRSLSLSFALSCSRVLSLARARSIALCCSRSLALSFYFSLSRSLSLPLYLSHTLALSLSVALSLSLSFLLPLYQVKVFKTVSWRLLFPLRSTADPTGVPRP